MSFLFWDTHQLALKYKYNIAFITDASHSKNNVGDGNDNSQLSISFSHLDELVNDAKYVIVEALKNNSSSQKQLIMMVARHTLNSVVYYLAALQLKQVIWWIDQELPPKSRTKLIQHYRVNMLIDNGELSLLDGAEPEPKHEFHADLAVLISTSGSTGSPSLVRLSYQNLQSNCQSIVQTLAIQSSDTVITTLPFQYSFGLSILHTHLSTGATIVLNEHSLLTREFWQVFKSTDIRCLYGVPFSFEQLIKLNLLRLPLHALRYLAVAGGKLTPEKITQINNWCIAQGKQLFVMYGQTEATARMSVLSPDKVASKPQSIGQAIAGGKLWLSSEADGNSNKQEGELCYTGANVMMGLATEIKDLSFAAETDVLHTGDLAICDEEGDFTIVGRLKRFIKVVGKRINLDDIETFLSSNNITAVCTGNDEMIACYIVMNSTNKDNPLSYYQGLVCQFLAIHTSYCLCVFIDEIPHLASGKVNYTALSLQKEGLS